MFNGIKCVPLFFYPLFFSVKWASVSNKFVSKECFFRAAILLSRHSWLDYLLYNIHESFGYEIVLVPSLFKTLDVGNNSSSLLSRLFVIPSKSTVNK